MMEKDLRQLRAQLEGLARLRFADPEHLTEQLQEAADAPASRRLRFASTPPISRRRALRPKPRDRFSSSPSRAAQPGQGGARRAGEIRDAAQP
jgi:hypothetical protein